MFCSKCGKEIMDEAVICPNCGCPTNNYSQPDQANVPYWNTTAFQGKIEMFRNFGNSIKIRGICALLCIQFAVK